jgi:hypothetical protein
MSIDSKFSLVFTAQLAINKIRWPSPVGPFEYSWSTVLRLPLANCLVSPCFMYGTETLTLRVDAVASIPRLEDHILAIIMQTRRSKFRDYEKNREWVQKLLKQEDRFWLVQRARLHRLLFYGHFERGTSICKDIVYSTPDTTRKGRQTTYVKEVCMDIQYLKVFHNIPRAPFACNAGDRVSFLTLCHKFIHHRVEKCRKECICGEEYRSKKPYHTPVEFRPARRLSYPSPPLKSAGSPNLAD